MKNTELIGEALKAYDIADAEYEIIRHNENITCRIIHDAKKYVLRIHQPVEGFCTSLITDSLDETELFRSEADLLLYMSKNGFEGLQQPIKNKNGQYITTLSTGVPAMLLTWIEGRPIDPEEGAEYAREIAELACRIHRSVQGFRGVRIHYDDALCERMAKEIEAAVQLDHLSESAGRKCIAELEAVKHVQSRTVKEQGISVIHSDLSYGNILITEHGLIPIDFSLAGYGCFAQEAGMAMSNYNDDESRIKLLEGFAECGEKINKTDADIFLSYSVLLFICSHHDRVYSEDWFVNALKLWCDELFIHNEIAG